MVKILVVVMALAGMARAQTFEQRAAEVSRQVTGSALELRRSLASNPEQGLPAPQGNGLTALCGIGRACSKEQSAIWEAYLQAPSLKPDAVPGVFSGACYHRAFYLDPQRPEYAAAFFDQRGGEYFYGGLFSFNLDSNPYGNWTVEDARRNLDRTYRLPTRLVFKGGHAEADFNPGAEPQVIYWFRREAASGDLLLLGYFSGGRGETSFCRLPRNPDAAAAQ